MRVDDTIVEIKNVSKELVRKNFIPYILNVQITGWDYDKDLRKIPIPVRIDKNTGELYVKTTVVVDQKVLEGKTRTQVLPRYKLPLELYPPGTIIDITVEDLVGENNRCYGITIANYSESEIVGVNFDEDSTADNHFPLYPGDVIGISGEIVEKLSLYFPSGYSDSTKLHIIPEKQGRS